MGGLTDGMPTFGWLLEAAHALLPDGTPEWFLVAELGAKLPGATVPITEATAAREVLRAAIILGALRIDHRRGMVVWGTHTLKRQRVAYDP